MLAKLLIGARVGCDRVETAGGGPGTLWAGSAAQGSVTPLATSAVALIGR
jgi:hypothetical protein